MENEQFITARVPSVGSQWLDNVRHILSKKTYFTTFVGSPCSAYISARAMLLPPWSLLISPVLEMEHNLDNLSSCREIAMGADILDILFVCSYSIDTYTLLQQSISGPDPN